MARWPGMELAARINRPEPREKQARGPVSAAGAQRKRARSQRKRAQAGAPPTSFERRGSSRSPALDHEKKALHRPFKSPSPRKIGPSAQSLPSGLLGKCRWTEAVKADSEEAILAHVGIPGFLQEYFRAVGEEGLPPPVVVGQIVRATWKAPGCGVA